MKRRFLARTCGVFAVLVLASCFGESTGPGELRPGRFAIAPRFDAEALRLVPVDRVHIVLYHADNSVALDTTVVFPAGSDTLDLSFEVEIQGASEQLELDIAMLDPQGAVVFQAPRTTVTATAGVSSPPPATPPMLYVGPGANAVGVRFVTTHAQVFFGDTVLFTAEAIDANNAVVAAAPIAWSSSDTSRARLPDPDVGRFIGNNSRGPATVRAGLLRTSATVPPAEVTNPLLVQPKPNQIAVQAGNNQSGPIGSPLALPVTARVRAADNLGVQGVSVTFVVSAGGGSLSSATAVTDGNGDASVTWTLGPSLGPQSVTATAAGVSGQSVSFTANGNVGNASRLVFLVQPANAGANVALAPPVQVEIQDAFGNRTSSTANVVIALANNPGSATLSGSPSINAVAGVATFNNLRLNNAGTGYTLAATSTGLTADTSNAFDVTGGVPTTLEFTTQPVGTSAGTPIGAFQVAIRDVNDNTVPGATDSVALNVTGNPPGVTLGGTIKVAAVNGVATFTNVTINRSGPGYTLTATATGLGDGISASFTIDPGPASQLVFTTQPPATVVEDAAFVVEATAHDAHGNVVTGFVGNVTVAIGTNPSSGTLGGTTTMAAVNGTATFVTLVIDNAGTGYTLTAAATGLAGATSNAFDVGVSSTFNQWINPAGGVWTNPANWSKGTVPSATDTVTITLDGTYTVTLDDNATIPMLVLGGATGIQTLQQAGFTLAVFDDYTIGQQGVHQLSSGGVLTGNGQGQFAIAGLLDWTGGTISSAHIHVAAGGELYATGNVSLAGDTIIVDGELDVGGSTNLGVNSGTLVTISSGGLLEFQSGGETVAHQFGVSPLLTVEAGATVDVGAAASFVSLNVPLVMDGVMNVPSGTLNLQNTVTINGTVTLAAAAQLTSQGTVIFGSSSAFSGAGTVRVTGGTLAVNGSYGVTGPLLIQGGVFVANSASPISIANVTLNGGQLNNTSQIIVTTLLLWQDGTLGGNGGLVQVPVGATLQLQGTGSKNLQQGAVDVGGTMVIDAGSPQTLGMNSGSLVRVLNGGVLDAQGDHTITHQFGGSPMLQIDAGGQLVRSAGSGTLVLNVPMLVDGQVLINAGNVQWLNTVSVNGGVTMAAGQLELAGTHTWNTGSLVDGAAELRVTSGALNANGSYALTGALRVQGGSAVFNNSTLVSLASVELSSGVLRGTGQLRVTGTMDWLAGTLGGSSGTLTIASGATLALATGGSKNLQDHTLQIEGVMTLPVAVPSLGINTSALLEVQPGGTIDLQGDQTLEHQFGGSPQVNVLAGGTITRSGGTGSLILNVPMTVFGDLNVMSGTLDWRNNATVHGTVTLGVTSSGLVSNGNLTISPTGAINGPVPATVVAGTFTVNGSYGIPGLLQVQGGSFVVNTGSPVNISQVQLNSGGTIAVTSPLNIAALTWNGGTISGSGLVTVNTASLAGGQPKNLQQAQLDVTANLTMSLGPMTLGLNSGAALRLQPGSFMDIEGDHFIEHQFGGGPLFLVMAGSTLRRNSGAGTLTINVPTMQVDGTFQLFTGNLTWSGGATVTGSVTLPTGTVTNLLGTHTWQAAASVTGGGELIVPSGILTAEGTSFGTTGPLRVAGGTVVLNNTTPKTLAFVELSGGILAGTGELTALSMSWTGGTVGGNMGTLIIPGASNLTLTTAAAKSVQAHNLHVNGTLTMAGVMTLGVNSGAQVAVNGGGTIDMGNGSIEYQFGGAPLLFVHPGGTLNKASGGTVSLNVPMQMQGSMNVSGGGTLEWRNTVAAGGTLDIATANLVRILGTNSWATSSSVGGGGDVEVLAGALLQLASGSSWGATGTLRVDGGTLDNAQSLGLNVLQLASGLIDGTGDITVFNGMVWDGGTFRGNRQLAIAGGASLNLGTGAARTLDQSMLIVGNGGSVNFSSGAAFTMGVSNGALIRGLAGSQINVFGDPQLVHQAGTLPTLQLDSGAVLSRLVSTGTASFQMALADLGALIAVNSGVLSFNGGGNFHSQAQAQPGATLRVGGGDWGILTDWSLTGGGDFVVENAAFENFNGNAATISGNMSVLGTTGRVDMTGAGDSLVVLGDLTWNTQGTSTLINGTLVLSGGLLQLGAAARFAARNDHVTVLNGGGAQTINFQTPGNQFAGLRVVKFSGIVDLQSDIDVADTLDLMSLAVPFTGAGRKVTLHNGALLDTNQITPRFLVGELVVRGQPSALPGFIPPSLTFDSGAVAPPFFISVGGDLTVKGLGPTHAILEATGASSGFVVGGNLVVTEDGVMNMSAPNAVSVAGNATFSSNNPNTGLIEGSLSVGGSFTQSGNAESFAASGNHMTQLNATGPGTISFTSPGALSGSSHFAHLTVNGGPYTIGSDVYTANLTIIGSGGITGPHRLAKSGFHNFAVGPVLAVRSFYLGSPGGSDDGITYTVDTTILAGSDFSTPGFNYNHLVVEGTDVFWSGGTIPGDLTITGSFSLNANDMTVGGNFSTMGQGVLHQFNSETMTVAGNVTFGGGDETGVLTSGLLRVGGNFTQTAANSDSSFAADISHVVEFNGSGAQTIVMVAAGPSRFGRLNVSNTAAAVTVLGQVMVGDEVSLQAGASLTGANARLHVVGAVVTNAGATLTPRWMGVEANIDVSAGGSVTPDSLEWLGFGRLLATGPAINPNNVIVNGTGNWTLIAPDTIGGDLSILQGIVSMNGNAVRVGGNFATANTAILEMNSPNDSLLVTGDVTFGGGGGFGFLNFGLIRVAGNFVQDGANNLESFHPDALHTTEFNGTAAQTVTFSSPGLVPGTSHFGAVRFANASASGVSLLTAAHAHILEDLTAGTAERLTGTGGTFQTQGLNVDNMVLSNLMLSVGDNYTITKFDNVTFTATPSTANQLTVFRGLGPSSMTFNNLTFQTVPTGAGLYLAATGPFTLNLVNPSPAGSTLFSQSGGATVNWP